MVRLCCAVLCVVLGVPRLVTATPAFDEAWPAVVRTLQKGEASLTGDELRSARESCKRLLAVTTLTTTERALTRQALAYANWRLVRIPGIPAGERDQLLEEAATLIGAAIADEPKNAELHALRSSVYGAMISFAPAIAITLGQQAADDIEQALSLAPNNPRVLLQEAVRLQQTPEAWGGDVRRAEATLRKALTLFAVEPVDRPWPNWGRADAHIWLGRILADRGDLAGARTEYTKALEAAPGHPWVRYTLLPDLDKRRQQ